MYIFPTNPNKLENNIAGWKSKKPWGYDGILSEILKGISHEIAYISRSWNEVFDNGHFPKALEKGIIM